MSIMAQDPTTSPERPQAHHAHPALQSTPQAKGSAAISEHISTVGVHVSDIRPWIMRDTEKFAKSSFDEILKDFLMDCTDKSQEFHDDAFKTRVFRECIDKVLPICNGEARNKSLRGKLGLVKEHLAAYTHVGAAKELYPHFVSVANAVLLFLQDLDIEDVRPASTLPPICFHVNDLALIQQTHQGHVSLRKPDVVVVSQSDASNACGSENRLFDQEDIFLGKASQTPRIPVEWCSVRTFVEFKKSTNKMEPPPDSYCSSQGSLSKEHGYLTMDVLDEEDVDAFPARSEPSGDNSRPPPSDSVRRSACLQMGIPTDSNSRKRTSDHLSVPESQSKRQKSEHRSYPVIVQAGYHAAEMFAAHAARTHVIGLIIVGDDIYLSRYDREGVIQCSGINFVQDLPRFLVLLLAMQRFTNRHWGLNPDIDPKFGHRPVSHQTSLHGEKGEKITISLELLDKEWTLHFDLNGRATNVVPVKSDVLTQQEDDRTDEEHGLVAKIFWAEVTRLGEPKILQRVYQIAQDSADVKGHIPEMLWYKVFEDYSTVKIRERLSLKTEGAQVLYIIIFQKLRPITELVGDHFLHAWWEMVICHITLWKNQVYHRDISPSNLMYRKHKGKIVGVLNDFDLASTNEMATGTERTGTIPFMAVSLLEDKALEGKIRHEYEHDAESFIWVLIWVTLRYDRGKVCTAKHGRPLDDWLGVDAVGCREKKAFFLYHCVWYSLKAGRGHRKNWTVAKKCIKALMQKTLRHIIATSDDDDDSQEDDADEEEFLQDDEDEGMVHHDDKKHLQHDLEEPMQSWDADTAFERLPLIPVSMRLLRWV